MQKHDLIDCFTDTNGEKRRVFLTTFNRDTVLRYTADRLPFRDLLDEPTHARHGDIVLTTERYGEHTTLGCIDGGFTAELYDGLRAHDMLCEARLFLQGLGLRIPI